MPFTVTFVLVGFLYSTCVKRSSVSDLVASSGEVAELKLSLCAMHAGELRQVMWKCKWPYFEPVFDLFVVDYCRTWLIPWERTIYDGVFSSMELLACICQKKFLTSWFNSGVSELLLDLTLWWRHGFSIVFLSLKKVLNFLLNLHGSLILSWKSHKWTCLPYEASS